MADTLQFKRGTAAKLWELNLTFAEGAPIFEYDTGKFKIGDGKTPWRDLLYIGEGKEGSVVTVSIFENLPSVGDEKILYKVTSTKKLYQWNSTTFEYEALGGGGLSVDEINIISGGKANG